MNLEIRKEYEAEQIKRWKGNRHMVDYCVNKAQVVVKTSKGYLIAIEKPSIKKNFCFGENGYDYNEKQEMAQHARTSVDYFMEENLADIEKTIKELKGENKVAYAQRFNENTNIRHLAILYPWWLLSFPWKYEADNGNLDELTEEDRQLLIQAYEQVKVAFVKRLNTYLKRYGLSKVRAWTYWINA